MASENFLISRLYYKIKSILLPICQLNLRF